MVIKRSFSTKFQPIEAFGLSNEVLRPAGFELGKANPPKSQAWRRGGEPGLKSKSLRHAALSIELDIERNRVNLSATADVNERTAAAAKDLLTAYAQALELVLAEGATPEAARALVKNAEREPKTGSMRMLVSVCVIIVSVLGGGVYIATTLKSVPPPVRWVLAKFSSGKLTAGDQQAGSPDAGGSSGKAKKVSPIVVVRRAGAQTNAQPQTEPPR